MEIIIHEVGLRDGLQMESEPVPTVTKENWVGRLMKSGVDIIQLGSFVNPAKMPQMADTDDLFELFAKAPNKPENVIFSGLVLNEKGFERGMACGAEMFCLGVSASETHSRKNTGMSVNDATDRIANIAKTALSAGKKVQASVQSAFGCGFEGAISEDKVYFIVDKYILAGVKIISLADTAGRANPAQVERLFGKIREMDADAELACHFHNTYGMGMANCYAAIRAGVKYFETAFGGLGGCPFTKSPAGNVATEDFVNMIQQMGYRKDINIDKIAGVTKYASGFFIKDFPGMIYKSGAMK